MIAPALRFPVLSAALAALTLFAFSGAWADWGANSEPDPAQSAAYEATPDAGAGIVEVQLVTVAQAGLLCFSSALGGVPHACVDEVLRVAELPQILEGGLGYQVP